MRVAYQEIQTIEEQQDKGRRWEKMQTGEEVEKQKGSEDGGDLFIIHTAADA